MSHTRRTFHNLMEADRAKAQAWDDWNLGIARHVAGKSKDPSTQVGAYIATEDNRPVSFGYNGFPQGVSDTPERYANRELKYKLIVHGEINAMEFAERSIRGCTLYTWPFMPCVRCAGVIIQRRIHRVVAPETPPELVERWGEDLELTKLMFREAGVRLQLVPRGNE